MGTSTEAILSRCRSRGNQCLSWSLWELHLHPLPKPLYRSS